MKKRLISIVIALLIFVPVFIIGGDIFKFSILLVGLLGFKEIIDVREEKKKFPLIMKVISYILFGILVLNNSEGKELALTLNYSILSLIIVMIVIPIVFYHSKDKYNIADALYLLACIIFLGLGFNLFIILRNYDLSYIIYLFLITIATDTFAFTGGMLSGRHKLSNSPSPNKSIEGLVIGGIFGTLVAFAFYYIVIDDSINLCLLTFITLVLSSLGQVGDLTFSAIKRYYGIKDFSNIMPGHGGILDRLDSIIFVLLGFTFFASII